MSKKNNGFVTVQLKNLRSNPYRDLGRYPINDDKIQLLATSIKETDFWNNILIRPKTDEPGVYEIAYGHHRIKALESLYDGDYEVTLPCRPLTDEQMVRIMANENLSDWKPTPKIINETIRAARTFLLDEKNRKVVRSLMDEGAKASDIERVMNKLDKEKIGSDLISRFLGANWPKTKVAMSLKHLKLEDVGTLSKEDVESSETQADLERKVKNKEAKQKNKDVKGQKDVKKDDVKSQKETETGSKSKKETMDETSQTSNENDSTNDKTESDSQPCDFDAEVGGMIETVDYCFKELDKVLKNFSDYSDHGKWAGLVIKLKTLNARIQKIEGLISKPSEEEVKKVANG